MKSLRRDAANHFGSGKQTGGTKFLRDPLHDAVTCRQEIDGNNARPAGGGNASQSKITFLRIITLASNVNEFLLRGGREDDLGKTETLANCREGVQHGFGRCAQIHDDIRVNGDERAGGGFRHSRVS